MSVGTSPGTARPTLPLKVGAVVGFLVFVEATSGFIQGFYLPLFGVLGKHLGVSDADITWFNTVQTLAAGVCVPVLSKLGDIFGHRRVLRGAIIAVLIGTLLIALSPNYQLVLLGRVIMGPLAVWLPLEIALVHNRISGDTARKAIGMLVSSLTFGLVLGNLSAGLATTAIHDFTVVLLIPAVIVALCMLIVFLLVPESTVRMASKIDYLGFAGLAVAMITFLWGLGQAQSKGFASPAVLVPLGIAVVATLIWVYWELRAKAPAVDLRLMTSRRMWPVYVTSFLFGVVIFGTQTIKTTFLAANPSIVGYGFSLEPGTISLFTAANALLATVGAVSFAPLSNKIGMRGVLFLGATTGVAGNVMLIFFNQELWQMVASTLVSGLSAGILLGALPALIAESAPRDQTGIASGLYNSMKTLGGSASGAVFGVVLTSFAIAGTKASSLGGYIAVWSACAVAFLLCLVALAFIRPNAKTPDQDQTVVLATEKEAAQS